MDDPAVFDNEKRIGKQLETTVRKDMNDKAMEEAIAAGKAPIPPKAEAIAAEVERRKTERLNKIKRDKEQKLVKARAAAKAQLESEANTDMTTDTDAA